MTDFKDILGTEEALELASNMQGGDRQAGKPPYTGQWTWGYSPPNSKVDMKKYAKENNLNVSPEIVVREVGGKKYHMISFELHKGKNDCVEGFYVGKESVYKDANGKLHVKDGAQKVYGFTTQTDNKDNVEGRLVLPTFKDKVSSKFYEKVVNDNSLTYMDKNLILMAKVVTSAIDKKYDMMKSNVFMIGEGHDYKMCSFLGEVCRKHISLNYPVQAATFEVNESFQKEIKPNGRLAPANVKAALLARTLQDFYSKDPFLTQRPKEVLAIDKLYPPSITTQQLTTKPYMDERDEFMYQKMRNVQKKVPGNENIIFNCGAAHLMMAEKFKKDGTNVIMVQTFPDEFINIFADLKKSLPDRINFLESKEIIKPWNGGNLVFRALEVIEGARVTDKGTVYDSSKARSHVGVMGYADQMYQKMAEIDAQIKLEQMKAKSGQHK